MNTKLKKAKNNFGKDLFKLMNNAIIGKTIRNVRKHRNIKLVTKERRRNFLVSESNYHATKFFTENLNETIMYKFWYDCVKPKYGENAKIFCIDTDSLIVYVKTQDIYKNISHFKF